MIKNIFSTGNSKIAGHVLIVLSILYYSTVVSAIIFESNKWQMSVLKGLPLFLLMSLSWLYFHRFKVLRLTFQSIAFFELGIFLVVYLPRLIATNGNPSFLFSRMANFSLATSGHSISESFKVFYTYAFLWSPHIFFVIFLLRGFKRKCPKCNWVNGLFARQIVRTELLSEGRSTATETTEKRSTIYVGPDAGKQLIEKESRLVTYITRHYILYCKCKVCSHDWSFYETITEKR